jgi:hypothetical protein
LFSSRDPTKWRTLSWFQARDAARDLNKCCGKAAHLVSITTVHELFFVKAITFGHDGWIGLNNMNQTNSSQFVWDGTVEAMSFTNWCGPDGLSGSCFSQYPIGGANRCVQLRSSGFWLDRPCSFKDMLTFFIEYDCD